MAHSMRKEYDENGVEGYYVKFGATYRNKHAPEIKRVFRVLRGRLPVDLLRESSSLRVLDLACGSGEATVAIVQNKIARLENIDACDPFTFAAYESVCNKPAFHWSFEDVANGALDTVTTYDMVVCSFALHLLDISKLFGCCYQLALKSKYLLLLSPHKRPEIKPEMGWELVFDIVEERIHAKLLRSCLIDEEIGN